MVFNDSEPHEEIRAAAGVFGGATKNGINEAALVGCETCIHNNQMDNVIDFFGKNNTKKIKTLEIIDSGIETFFTKIKNEFPKLDDLLKGNDALKKSIYKDFEKAENTVLKALENEETFKVYKQFRTIEKETIICK